MLNAGNRTVVRTAHDKMPACVDRREDRSVQGCARETSDARRERRDVQSNNYARKTMAKSESLKISREDLYELVWSKPIVELAKDLGLSDVGLAKRCRNALPD